jgi:metallo-beta-lactamase class B
MKSSILLVFAFLFSTYIFAQTKTNSLQIIELTPNYYIYITYHTYKGDIATANGMYVVTNNGVVIIDTPWDTTQFQPLLDSIKTKHHKKVVLCIATHSHGDRTAGLEFFRQQNIPTYTSIQTDSISKATKQKRAQFHFSKDTTFNIGQLSFQTFYPGQGHTADNIVIWFGKEKIIYGGCFIKSVEATDLGYIQEANLFAWPASLKNVQQKFPQPKFIIPGHDAFTNLNAINHTLKLLQQNKK